MDSVGMIFILQTKRVDQWKWNFIVFSILGIKNVSSDTCIAALHSAGYCWKISKLYHLAAY